MHLGTSCIRTASGHKHEILNFLVSVLRTPEFVLVLHNFRAQIPNRKQFHIKSEVPNFTLMKKRAEEKSENLTILDHHLGVPDLVTSYLPKSKDDV